MGDALSGSGASGDCGNNVVSQIAVIWGFDSARQTYQAYFPGVNIAGANDLVTLTQGLGYWVALLNPSSGAVQCIVPAS